MRARIEQDTGGRGLSDLGKRLRELAARRVLVGVPKEAKPEEDGTSMALVAARTEFGDPTPKADGSPLQPERPFLREGIRHGMPKIKRVSETAARAVANNQLGPEAGLDLVGLEAAGQVKLYMAGPNFAPNAPSTIANKGSAQPTIASGNLRASITHVVEAAK